MSEHKVKRLFEVRKSAFPPELYESESPPELNESERKVRDELLPAAANLNNLSAAGPSKKTKSRRRRAKAFKQKKQLIANNLNRTKHQHPKESRHATLEKHWNEKIRLLQPMHGPLPLFLNESTKNLEVIRMKQELCSANALKSKFGKTEIPTVDAVAQSANEKQKVPLINEIPTFSNPGILAGTLEDDVELTAINDSDDDADNRTTIFTLRVIHNECNPKFKFGFLDGRWSVLCALFINSKYEIEWPF